MSLTSFWNRTDEISKMEVGDNKDNALNNLKDHSVDEMVLKMCALGSNCYFNWRMRNGVSIPFIDTPFGRYDLILDCDESRLVVDQVL